MAEAKLMTRIEGKRAPNVNLQMLYLFLSNFTILFVGMGLFPVLPLYAAEFGASRTLVGIFFAIMYVANASGPLLVVWLEKRLSRRALFILSGAVGVPALALIGQVSALWQVILLTAVVWFSGGLNLGLANIFTGLYAGSRSRGKSFGFMSLAFPLGALVGGTVVGQLVTTQGYAFMFVALAVLWTALPLIGLFGLRDPESPVSTGQAAAVQPHGRMGSAFLLLLGLTLVGTSAISVSRLGTSLAMQALDFDARQIAGSATVSGLVTIPAVLLIGALSDRFGRKQVLVGSYLLAAVGSLTLSAASQLWQFWAAASLMLVAFVSTGAVAAALATDMLPRAGLNRGLSVLKSSTSAAGILSFAATGYLMDTLGATTLFLLVSALPVAAAGLIELLPAKGETRVQPPAWTRTLACRLHLAPRPQEAPHEGC